MASDLRKTILNTRERWTSTKYNKQVQIHDRNLQEVVRHITNADEDLSGVVSGLLVGVNAGTFQVTVGRGLALLFDASKAAPDSQYRWIEIETSETATVPAADPVNPRWDVIEIEAGVTSLGALSRDIFDPTLGTFTAQNVSVEERAQPVVSVRSGTAAAAPAFPAGMAGRIPLAYVLVPAAAPSLPTDGLVHCRPILRAPGAIDVGSDTIVGLQDENVRGGGVYVSASGLNFQLQKATGRWKKHRISWGVDQGVSMALGVNLFDGAFPGSDAPIYVYAAKPPYPSGYGALAGREFLIGGPAADGQFASGSASVPNAVIVASDLPPNTETLEGEQLAGGSFTLLDPPFGGAAALTRNELVYLGAARFITTGPAIRTQEIRGNRVNFLSASESRSWDLATGSGTAESLYVEGVPMVAQVMHVVLDALVAISSVVAIAIADETPEPAELLISTGGVAPNTRWQFSICPDKATGEVTLTWSDLAGAGITSDPSIRVVGYDDCILSRR